MIVSVRRWGVVKWISDSPALNCEKIASPLRSLSLDLVDVVDL